MKIHCLQHVAFEHPGLIADWATAHHHPISYTYLFNREFVFPALDSFDAVLILGGYMNVYEEEKYPWLAQEKVFIRSAIDAGKKVLGICLGAQLIADVLGAKVYAAKEIEIGFWPIHLTADALQHPLFHHFNNPPYYVFHWHGDTFDILPHGVLLASSECCKHQAFAVGNNILGLLFHFEMNELLADDLLHFYAHVKGEGKYIQSAETIRKGYTHFQKDKKDLYRLLDKFFIA